jgi:glutaminyl-peptide cyclotransferase
MLKTQLSREDRGGWLRNYRLQVLRRLPHPGRGFTQGLVLRGSTIWESTGLYGQSALIRYQLGAGDPDRGVALAPELFGEGICHTGRHLWQLTWRERVALRWDPEDMRLIETVRYNREGWGIAEAGEHVVTSDGSSELVRRDPQTLKPLETIRVRLGGQRLEGLNDLAWDGDMIWANVLTKTYLAAIDLASGQVTAIADARSASERFWRDPEAVMNGVTPLAQPGEFLLTGKRWRRLYHVRLSEGQHRVRRRGRGASLG